MLTKITDDFYIDLAEVCCVEKLGREIYITLKVKFSHEHEYLNQIIIFNNTKKGREFMRIIELYWLQQSQMKGQH